MNMAEKYYHILLWTKNYPFYAYEYDLNMSKLNDRLSLYSSNKEFHVGGHRLIRDEVRQIVIKYSEKTLGAIWGKYNPESKYDLDFCNVPTAPRDIISQNVTELQNVTIEDILSNIQSTDQNSVPLSERKDRTKIFIVHGHDNALKQEVARFLEQQKITPIILHEQANAGKTIIEKIDHESTVGYGIVLYTPCDIGKKNIDSEELRPRARQNVVLEHGFLLGRLGRSNVIAIKKGDVEQPSDTNGILYIDYNSDWKLQLAKELQNAGYIINMNDVQGC